MISVVASVVEMIDLSFRQLVRSKQLIGIGVVIAVAGGIAWLIDANSKSPAASDFQAMQVLILSTVVVPLIALLLGTAAMASERENGTLAYLFVRPFPRAAVVIGKGLGAIVAANAATLVCTLVVWLASGAPKGAQLGGGIGALLLEATALTAVFVLFGTLAAKSLYLGLAYVALFEGLLGNTVGESSGTSVTYHARNLLSEWSSDAMGAYAGELERVLPGSAGQSVLVLLGVTLAALAGAAFWVETREYGLRDRSKEE